MKQLSLLTIILACLFMNSYGNSRDTLKVALGIEKEYMTYKKVFVFKPDKGLKIKTKDGKKYFSYNYSFADNYIVMKLNDTISFDNIKSIQGKIYGDEVRKLMGAIIAFGALPAGAFAVFIYTFSGGAGTVAAAPFVAMLYGGLRLTGSRRFQMGKDYHLVVIRPEMKPLALTD